MKHELPASPVDQPSADRIPVRKSLLTGRFSASNEAARAAQRQRIAAMTPYQRIALAFALGRSHAALRALGCSPSKQNP